MAEGFFIQLGRINQGKLLKIDYEKVQYVLAAKDYCEIHLTSKRYIIHSSLKKVQQKLEKEGFFRVQNSCIVNIRNIRSIYGDIITTDSGKQIMIGRSYKSSFLKYLQDKTITI